MRALPCMIFVGVALCKSTNWLIGVFLTIHPKEKQSCKLVCNFYFGLDAQLCSYWRHNLSYCSLLAFQDESVEDIFGLE